MNLCYRKISKEDYPVLREYLYEAIYLPEGVEPYDRSIIDLPEIARYINNWNDSSDFGLIACNEDETVGVIWGRLFMEDNKGYGFIDINTPEISMAINKKYRNQGFGTALMKEFINLAREKRFKSLSLSVDKRNRAYNLYVRTGFIIVDDRGPDYIMKKKL
ncbi:MAG TPA: GNAT family N-acetyltransferase [Bacteroidales bacterium]|nr:GNAT family N-acetyltransferase [Bacteroidales bacterium]